MINSDVIDYFVEFNWQKGEFYYYDKVAKAKRPIDLKALVILNVWYTIAGYSQKQNSGIYSNEIADLRDTAFEVKAFGKDGAVPIAKWLYKDIKNDVVASWGKLHICLSALSGMEVVHLKLKGAAFYEYTQFLQDKWFNPSGKKLVIEWTEDRQNGAISYKVPKFAVGEEFTENEKSLLIDIRSKLLKKEEEPTDDEELPF